MEDIKMKKPAMVMLPSLVLFLWFAFSLEAVTNEAGFYSGNTTSAITQNHTGPLPSIIEIH
jgi:hypothetical protein